MNYIRKKSSIKDIKQQIVSMHSTHQDDKFELLLTLILQKIRELGPIEKCRFSPFDPKIKKFHFLYKFDFFHFLTMNSNAEKNIEFNGAKKFDLSLTVLQQFRNKKNIFYFFCKLPPLEFFFNF